VEFYRVSNSRVRNAVEGPVFRGCVRSYLLSYSAKELKPWNDISPKEHQKDLIVSHYIRSDIKRREFLARLDFLHGR
jgi:hypothetical protein